MRIQEMTICAPGAPRAAAVGHAARREQFQRDHPDAEISGRRGAWLGSLPVSGTRREVKDRDLGSLLDCLERLAAMNALERDFPGWHVWQSSVGRWWATRTAPRVQLVDGGLTPMTVDGDDEDGLRAELARYTLAEVS